MSKFHHLQSGTALFTALALTAGAATPLVIQAPAQAQAASFSDVSSDYWARGFVQELANRGVISGFPDGTFRPNEPVTRVQFAAMLRQAFSLSNSRPSMDFTDVPSDYWGTAAIQKAVTMGFMSGYPEGDFRPEQNIPRAQVLVSLANGLGYSPMGSTNSILQVYNDAGSIPDWARNSIAAATEKQMVVNYPSTASLSPNRAATRAEVAAFIYQALASRGTVARVPSPYIVGQGTTTPNNPQPTAQLPIGTAIPARYADAERILISPEEPAPVPLTLTISRNVTAANGVVLIPANSQVVGELRVVDPEEEVAQFYAKELVMANGTRMTLNATSRPITETETVMRGVNFWRTLAGAALGSGAAAAIAGVTGDEAIATEEVLGGTAVGTLAGLFLGRNRATLIEIESDTDLDLTLTSPLAMQ